mgnify:CR=1 FL=1
MLRAHILGTSSAVPAYGRHPSAQILEHNDRYLLIDCGEATQFQLQRYKFRLRRLDAIFISHLHGDHVYGLPGLLSSMSMGSRSAKLEIIGPVGIAKFIQNALSATDSHLSFQLAFNELPTNHTGEVYSKRGLAVNCFPLKHRVPTFGYRFQELRKPRRFLVERAQALDIPPKFFRLLKQENSVKLSDGRTIEPNDVLGERPPSFSYAYCSDTLFHRPIIAHIKGVDGLYHEATFLHELLHRAKSTKHTTAKQAGVIAREADVGQLILGHYSARYPKLDQLLAEARTEFEHTELGKEGRVFEFGQDA